MPTNKDVRTTCRVRLGVIAERRALSDDNAMMVLWLLFRRRSKLAIELYEEENTINESTSGAKDVKADEFEQLRVAIRVSQAIDVSRLSHNGDHQFLCIDRLVRLRHSVVPATSSL